MANHTVYERDKNNIMKYQKEKTSPVTIRLKNEEKNRWVAYTESKGLPLATLIRQLMDQEMNS